VPETAEGSCHARAVWAIWAAFALLCCAASAESSRKIVQWTSNPSRNVVSEARGLPDRVGEANRLWEIKRGEHHFGSPVVVGDKVLIVGDARSIHNERLARAAARRSGVIACVSLFTGETLWELTTRLNIADTGHWEFGPCSTPTAEGDRAYVVETGGNVLCLDMHGQANGNDGPFTDELDFMTTNPAGKLTRLEPTDGDILWRYDIADQHKALFHDAYNCLILIQDDYLWVTTNHCIGQKPVVHLVDSDTENSRRKFERQQKIAKDVPNLLVLDKNTGKLLAHDDVRVEQVFHGQWSSPSLGMVDGSPLVFWGDGYGVLHAFEPPARPGVEGKVQILKERWRCDCNPPEYRLDPAGNSYPYPTGYYKPDREYNERKNKGPCPIIGTPVLHDGRIYLALGRDHNEGFGPGVVVCIDPRGTGDITKTGIVWSNKTVGKSLSTPAVYGGLLYVGDTDGNLHCLDATTGATLWSHRVGMFILFCSPFVADGKVYVAPEEGSLCIFKAGREKELISAAKIGREPSTPTAVDGLLIVPTGNRITAYYGPRYDGPRPTVPAKDLAHGRATDPPALSRAETQPLQAPPGTDWTGFRGSARSNLCAGLPETLPDPPKLVWKRPLTGMVYSSVVVANGRVVTMDHRKDREDIVRCFQADSGEPAWDFVYPNTGARIEFGDCPRATPAIADGVVVSLGARGQLSALDLRTGTPLWKKDLVREFGAKTPTWGYSASPLIADGKVVVQPGGNKASFVALQLKTGQVLWSSPGGEANYGSPVVVKVNGVDQVIGFDRDNLVGRSLADGKVLWSKPLPSNSGYVVPSPVVAQGKLLQCGDGGAYLMKLGAGGALPEGFETENDSFRLENATPTVLGDLVLGTSQDGGLVALDLTSNLRRLWNYDKEKTLSGFANLLAANDRALVLDAAGTLHLFSVSEAACKPLAKARVCGNTHCGPALVGSKLFVRDAAALCCYDLSPPPSAPDTGRPR
jgi:outer membrane protein assembly factor BamB